MKYCSVNGIETKTIALNERGLAYGDGIFTTAKVTGGQITLLSQHIQRLVEGCQKLAIPFTTQDTLIPYLQRIVKPYSLAVLKIMVTAGNGGRGYSRAGITMGDINVIVTISDFPKQYKALLPVGINVVDSVQQIAVSPLLGGLKHLNRLEQVLLRTELDALAVEDLIVTNCQGYVIEATSANLFYWSDDELCTPDLLHSGVNGIIRQKILEQHPEVKIKKITPLELETVDEMFLCNSLMGIMPIKSYNNRQLNLNKVLKFQSLMSELI